MAEDIRSMRIELSMRDMGVERTVGNIKQSFNTLKSEISNSTRMFNRSEKTTQSYVNQLRNLRITQANLKNELKAATRAEAKMTEQHGANSSQALKARASVSRLKEEIDYMGKEIDQTSGEMRQFNLQQERLAKAKATPFGRMKEQLKGIAPQMRTVGASMKNVGRSMSMYVTAPIVAGFGGAIKASVDYEQALAGVAKTTNLSGKELKQMSTDITKMSNTMPFAATEIAGVAEAAGQLGVKKSQITDFTKTMLDMSVATNMTSEEAATEFARFANAAGMPISKVDRLGSTVVALGNNTATTEKEIVDMGQRLAGAGKQAGFSADEIMSIAAAMSSVGIDAEAGGTAMTQIMNKITKATADGGSTLDNFAKVSGMSAEEFSQTWEKNPTQALSAFVKGLGNTQGGAKGVIKALDSVGIKGIREADTIRRMANNHSVLDKALKTGKKGWQDNTALTKEAETRYKTLGSKLKVLKNNFVNFGRSLGDTFGPAIGWVADKLSGLFKYLQGANPILKGFVAVFGLIAAAIGPVVLGLGALIAAIGAIAESAVAMSILGGIFAAITSPVTLIVAGVLALGTALVLAYQKSQIFRNIINTVFAPIKAIFGAVMNQFKQAGNEILPVLANHFKLAFGQAGAVVRALQPIVTTVFNAIKNVAMFVLPGIKAMFNNTFQGIKNIVTGAFDIILGALKIFAALFTGNSKLLWSGVKQIFSGFIKIIVGIFRISFVGQILAFARGMVKSVTGVFRNLGVLSRAIFSALGKWISAKWQAIRNSVVNKVKSLWNGVKATWAALKTGTINIIASVGTWLGKKWQAIRNSVVAKVKSLWSGVSKTWHSLKSGTVKIIASVASWLSKTWTSIKNAVISRAKSLWNGVRNTFNALNKGIHNIFNSVKNFTLKLWTSVKNGVVSRAKSLWNNVKNVFNSLKKGVSNIFNSVKNTAIKIWNSIKKSVVNLANGAKNGVVNGFKAMFNKGKEWLNKLLGFIKNAKAGFKNAATSLGKSVANGAISGLNAMIDGINSLSNKIMKKKLIKNKIPKLSTGTGASPGVQTNSQGQLTKSTKAVINDKGIGNAKGPNGHREIIQRRNGKFEQPSGRNKVVRLKRGDAVHNGMQSKALRPHLSTGTLPHLSLGSFAGDLFSKGKKKVQHGYHETLDTSKNLVEDGKKWAGDKAKSFGKAIGDVMSYVKNPMKLVDKTLKHFGVDFSNIKGAMGGTMSWAYNGLKNGMKDLVGKWLEDAQGGDGDAGWLLKHKILQYFGHYTGGLNFNGGRHYGIDFAMPTGTKIKALTDGLVTQAGPVTGGGGNQVTLKEPGGKWFQWYMHMSKVLAHKGDKVKAGDLLGLSGSTGNSTTPHIHIQRMKGYASNATAVNPMKWLKSLGSSNKSASKWKPDIQRAAKQMKVNLSGSELNDIARLINTESSGNAGIIQQIHDVNTGANRARGLLQYTPGTFGSYKVKGHGNIMSGYDQLLAFFNNSSWRGNLSAWKRRMAAGSTGWGPTGSRRFATGGVINSNGMYNIAEDGHSEVVVPLDPKRATDAMKLISYAQSKVKDKKNKRPNQIPNKYGASSGNDSETLQALMQMVANQQEEIKLLREIAQSNRGIEDKAGFNERDVSNAQGKRAQMMAFNYGGAI
ncbi:phage tail tape measure protein [Staphylococcus kloosii]|uniref:phage tail tape measure protein n=1 Tax=Staphylococcus kloosii TaxID=29384 RepID=UPI00189CB684|nr:phage tail tape measure protein [Staphylococcus kloosii]MBF7023753.1 phage tail tape measure protein [Staphylococcus kloosii]